MGTALEKLLGDVTIAIKYNAYVLDRVYRSIQQKEAEKTPGEWKPYRIVVGALEPVQIFPGNLDRSSVAIKNDGGAEVLLSNQNFDAAQATNDFNAQNYGSVGTYYPLAVGESVNIDSTGPIYAYAIGYTTGGTTFSILRCLESLYEPGTIGAQPRIHDHRHKMGHIDKGVSSPYTSEQRTALL